ncbi:KpsF/GutQ family sugar-phosphate isomerase [bacterium]|nr:KpsF/GutQ family sugar-phosphate isomerase [bacterium]
MKEDIINQAKKVLRIEAEAVRDLADKINENFSKAVDMLYYCQGRVVVTGMGKSGLIGQKIASTLSSTGTPALFLHPAEGIHGDLGMVIQQDVVIALSNSGETEELLRLIPAIKRAGALIVALSGNSSSTLASYADLFLDVSVKEEACPLGLAPTASTTAALAMGDALAVALLSKRGFNKEDFALLHPGGTLGKQLLLKVEDIMHKGEDIPLIEEEAAFTGVVAEISKKGLGVTGVVDREGRLVGIVTDGDIRRLIQDHGEKFFAFSANRAMARNPKTISPSELGVRALSQMERFEITALFVLDQEQKPLGIVHIHDLLKAGVVLKLEGRGV